MHDLLQALGASPHPVVRNNIMVALSDMVIQFTALVDSHMPRLAACIRWAVGRAGEQRIKKESTGAGTLAGRLESSMHVSRHRATVARLHRSVPANQYVCMHLP